MFVIYLSSVTLLNKPFTSPTDGLYDLYDLYDLFTLRGPRFFKADVYSRSCMT